MEKLKYEISERNRSLEESGRKYIAEVKILKSQVASIKCLSKETQFKNDETNSLCNALQHAENKYDLKLNKLNDQLMEDEFHLEFKSKLISRLQNDFHKIQSNLQTELIKKNLSLYMLEKKKKKKTKT